MTEHFVVGIVRGSHGITGEFKVESASGEYSHFANMEEVSLTDGTVQRTFKVEKTSIGTGCLFMKLAGINSPEEAAVYNRWQIVVPRENAHPLQKGEWYIEDLKGCSVIASKEALKEAKIDEDVTAGGTAPASVEKIVVGTVTDVLEGGSGYLVEISLSESCSVLVKGVNVDSEGNEHKYDLREGQKVYVPFNKEFWGEVDVKKRTMLLMHLWILE
ncbi:MAG: 16S rRNA processing protein RimM [Treponema sp.]